METDSGEIRISREYSGIPASPGIAIGHAFIYDNEYIWIEEKNIHEDMIEHEKSRFDDAINKVIKDLKSLRYKLEQKIGEKNASIFDPHIMLLQDPEVINETYKYIEKGKCAEFAFFRTTRKIIKAYKRIEDDYMRERIADIKDIIRRVSITLMEKENGTLSQISNLETHVIIIAPNLTPSDAIIMHSSHVFAFVTDTGGLTSHASILARALEIPAVIGVKSASSEINPGDLVIVDGNRGKVCVNPDLEMVEKFKVELKEIEKFRLSLAEFKDVPAITTDGFRIGLQANIEFSDEVNSVIANGAEGIGLFRSEFHYLMANEPPMEDHLFNTYFEVAKRLAPKPVIIRTLDIGGDKISHITPSEIEANPFLGWRAIRVSLALKELFKVQLRAIVRASALRNISVLFPMISSMDELNETLSILDEVKAEIKHEGYEFDPDMQVGTMIEIPAAVMIAHHLAKKSDFFSIGTNDLIQYSVAVDRSNDRIAYLFEPFHPGILNLIKMTIDAAHSNGIPVAVCGEMSSDPAGALLLIGLGINELSMVPSFIPKIKRMICSMSMNKAKNLAVRALQCDSASAVKNYVHEEMKNLHL